MRIRKRGSASAAVDCLIGFALLALLPASPASGDWQITEYTGTDQDACIAWNGDHYLIAWERDRNDTSLVYGRRVTSSRQFAGDEIAIWDPVLSSSPGGALYPQVSGSGEGGSSWLVVWRNEYGGVMEILGRTVSRHGVPEPTVLAIGTTDYFSPTPVLAWNGAKWLVVWEGYQSSYRFIQGRFVYPDGSTGAVFTIDQEASVHKYRARAGALGSDFFVAWMDHRDGVYNIHGKKVFTDGTLSARVRVSNCDGTDYTNTVSGGSAYFLVTWRCLGTGGNAHIWGQRVHPSTLALAGTKFEISSDQINNSGAAPWTGSCFKVAYDLLSLGPYYRPVYEDGSMGTETDLSALLSSGVGTYLAAAQGDTNCLCVWEANIGNRDIYADGMGANTGIESDRGWVVPAPLSVTPCPLGPEGALVQFGLARRGEVSIDVYDITGRRVANVVNKALEPGEHSLEWRPRGLASGLYFIRFTTEENPPVTQKIVFLK